MTPERIARLKKCLRQRQPDLTVLTDHVHKGRNLSAIVRNCDAVGIGQVHSVIPDGDYRAFRGTSMGSHNWVKVRRYAEVSEPLNLLKSEGYQLVAADLTDAAVDYREVDYTRPTALVLGAERWGVSEQAKQAVDYSVVIPMMGLVKSFNVSVASAIILTEAMHQRQQAGLYDHQRISQQEFDYLYFRWAYPDLRHYCDQHEITYPPVDEEGYLLNPSEWYAKVREMK